MSYEIAAALGVLAVARRIRAEREQSRKETK